MPAGALAWWRHGEVDLAGFEWPDATGNGHTAQLTQTVSGTTNQFSLATVSGYGAAQDVAALRGTSYAGVSFGPVVKTDFTICSVTRYTGSTGGTILTS